MICIFLFPTFINNYVYYITGARMCNWHVLNIVAVFLGFLTYWEKENEHASISERDKVRHRDPGLLGRAGMMGRVADFNTKNV